MASPRPTPQDLPPAVQPVFDALEAYMTANGYNSCNASETYDGGGKNQTIIAYDPFGVKVNYALYTPGQRIVISPPSANLGPGGSQQFTAVAQNPDGTPVTPAPTFVWSIIPGAVGSIDTNGLYRAPSSIPTNATDSCKCAAQGTQAYAVFTVSLHP